MASGDPGPDHVVLWTRLMGQGLADAEAVTWWLGPEPDPARALNRGTYQARADEAHSVHVTVDGLKPATTWYYGFEHRGRASTVGRTRTTGASSLVLAAVSCQNYEDGYFVVHRHLAGIEPDLVLFLGDYTYAGPPGSSGVRTHEGPAPVTLDDHRRRLVQYRRDPDLRALHATAPMVVIRDDNEVGANWSGDHPRRAAAEQALFEHLPLSVRPPGPPGHGLARHIELGPLGDLIVLDTRPFRSPPASCPRVPGTGAVRSCPELEDTERTMLGPVQQDWLTSLLDGSTGVWQLVASQVMVADLAIELGGRIVNPDQWDGFPAARHRLAAELAAAPAPLVISGDLHAGMVALVEDVSGTAVATEVVTPSVSSSLGATETLAISGAAALAEKIIDVQPERRGAALIRLDREQAEIELLAVDDARQLDSAVGVGARFVLAAGDRRPRRA